MKGEQSESGTSTRVRGPLNWKLFTLHNVILCRHERRARLMHLRPSVADQVELLSFTNFSCAISFWLWLQSEEIRAKSPLKISFEPFTITHLPSHPYSPRKAHQSLCLVHVAERWKFLLLSTEHHIKLMSKSSNYARVVILRELMLDYLSRITFYGELWARIAFCLHKTRSSSSSRNLHKWFPGEREKKNLSTLRHCIVELQTVV